MVSDKKLPMESGDGRRTGVVRREREVIICMKKGIILPSDMKKVSRIFQAEKEGGVYSGRFLITTTPGPATRD